MAVYTVLDAKDISNILEGYDVGDFLRFEPISSGIENTNYFVWTQTAEHTQYEWVLTIFENIAEASVPFFNNLTLHLKQKRFAVPAPQKMKNDQLVFSLQLSNPSHKKYGVLVPKFEGKAVERPDILLCQKVGGFAASMHLSLFDFAESKDVLHSYAWCKQTICDLEPSIPQDDLSVLNLALERYQSYQALIDQCSSGIVHGDLFRDNVLFDKGEISGVIDFYNAGKTAYLFDLAVVANDWAVNFESLPALFCQNQDENKDAIEGVYNEQKLDALLASYQAIKPFSEAEKKAWPYLLELAAFRFYLSRLKTKYIQGYQQTAKAGDAIKSPNAMKIIMLAAMAR